MRCNRVFCSDAVMEVNGDDPKLIQHLREKVLLLPSELPYNLQFGVHYDPSEGQSVVIDKILGSKVSHNNMFKEFTTILTMRNFLFAISTCTNEISWSAMAAKWFLCRKRSIYGRGFKQHAVLRDPERLAGHPHRTRHHPICQDFKNQ